MNYIYHKPLLTTCLALASLWACDSQAVRTGGGALSAGDDTGAVEPHYRNTRQCDFATEGSDCVYSSKAVELDELASCTHALSRENDQEAWQRQWMSCDIVLREDEKPDPKQVFTRYFDRPSRDRDLCQLSVFRDEDEMLLTAFRYTYDKEAFAKDAKRREREGHGERYPVDFAFDDHEAFAESAARTIAETCLCEEGEVWDGERCVSACERFTNCTSCAGSTEYKCSWVQKRESDDDEAEARCVSRADAKAEEDDDADVIERPSQCIDCSAYDGDADTCLGVGICGVCDDGNGAVLCKPFLPGVHVAEIAASCGGGYYPTRSAYEASL